MGLGLPEMYLPYILYIPFAPRNSGRNNNSEERPERLGAESTGDERDVQEEAKGVYAE